jgi:chromosome segregation ATPase
VFTSALAQEIGVASGLIALILVVSCFVSLWMPRMRTRAAGLAKGPSQIRWPADAPGTLAQTPEFDRDKVLAMANIEGGSDIDSLVSAVRDQAVELRCEHAKAVSNLSLNFDLLANRLSTMEPLVKKAMEAAKESESSVGRLTASNADYDRKLAQAERDLAFYRPLALKLEDELRVARNNIAESERKFAVLDSDHARSQGAHNELFQKMASAEMARQRASEENSALVQKLNEHDSAIQSLLRETAHLKSEATSIAGELERAEQESKALAARYTVEREGNSRAKAELTSLEAQFNQFRRDAAAQIAQVEERELSSRESLSIKEKQFYDSEIKRSALDSKLDFLIRTNQRLREDLRRSLDHIGNLEASNRKLLESLARNSAAEEQDIEAKEIAPAARVAPKLRAVTDGQTADGASTKAV